MRIPVLCVLVLAAACGPTERMFQQVRCAGERPYRALTADELDAERGRIIGQEMRAITGTRSLRKAMPTTLLPPEVEARLEEFARDKEEAESAAAAFRVEEECRQAEVERMRDRAGRGDTDALINLGLKYADGEGVPKDDREAVRLFRLAAALGDARAQSGLGFMYARGRGVRQDGQEAVRWYRLAAGQGHAPAQAALEDLEQQGAAERGSGFGWRPAPGL